MPGRLLPAVDQRAAFRPLDGEITQDGEAVGVLARAASTASSFESGSQEAGGWMIAASTPASAISRSTSSVE